MKVKQSLKHNLTLSLITFYVLRNNNGRDTFKRKQFVSFYERKIKKCIINTIKKEKYQFIKCFYRTITPSYTDHFTKYVILALLKSKPKYNRRNKNKPSIIPFPGLHDLTLVAELFPCDFKMFSSPTLIGYPLSSRPLSPTEKFHLKNRPKRSQMFSSSIINIIVIITIKTIFARDKFRSKTLPNCRAGLNVSDVRDFHSIHMEDCYSIAKVKYNLLIPRRTINIS